ncbi:MAG: tetratricopeptide repeat protein [Luteitalea sp.]|nr:tetratricopeptide repeat protein [Luteitalea sp.]
MRPGILSIVAILSGAAILAQEGQSAQQLFEAGQNDQALQAIMQMRERGTAGPAETYLAGQILLKANQHDGARREFESLAPSGVEVWKLIGASAIAALDNNNQGALDAATQATQASAGQFEAQYQLGYAKARLDDWAGSAEALERAIAINPEFAYAYYNAGQAYSRIKRTDRTAEHFERFLKLAPKAPERAAVESLMRTLRGR